MLKIYIARHGQNVDNVNEILNGHRDEPLTELGESQARNTAAHIKENQIIFEKIYSSPLQRAHQTAKIIADELQLPTPEVLPSLIERNFGSMTGKPVMQIEALCAPEIIKTDTVTYFLSPPEAETFPELLERGQRVIAFITENHRDGSVLLVTHGDMGKMIYAAYYGLDWNSVLTSFHFGNCELLLLAPNCTPEKAHVYLQDQHNH